MIWVNPPLFQHSMCHEICTRALSQSCQYKDSLSRYGNFHHKDKMVSRQSYLYNGNPYTGNTTSLYGVERASGPCFNIKMSSYQYRKSHCGDKTLLRPSYLHNGISYTGKMSSSYWIRALVLCFCSFELILLSKSSCDTHVMYVPIIFRAAPLPLG